MHKLVVAVAAVPILVLVYMALLRRRSVAVRVGATALVAAGLGLGIAILDDPRATTATPPSAPRTVPVTEASLLTAVRTDHPLDAPVEIAFSVPMQPESVAAALAVDPPVPVELAWDATGTRLRVSPATTWRPDTYHAVVVEAGALARTGRPSSRTFRVDFLTESTWVGRIAATDLAGRRASVRTAFTITFGREVDAASVVTGLRVDPPLEGTLETHGAGLGASATNGSARFVFRPAVPLRPDTRYELTVTGVRTLDGVLLDPVRLTVRTITAPAVVRFRPRDGTGAVPRDAAISVRFTEAMDPASTRRAFRVAVDGSAVSGRIRFAEGDTVLVFDPDEPLPFDATVEARVEASAASALGAPLGRAARATFETVPKPAPTPRPTPRPTTKPPSGGGSVGSGSWTAVEAYYLKLMNCTRTGGWVSSTGTCTSPGGRDVPPLKLHTGISNAVARPYAKLLATRGLCDHFIGGTPGDRLRRAGYTSYRWAENLGCRSGDPYAAVLGSHRYFQSEESYNGGHWVNMMSTRYSHAGIGVWVYAGRVRLVVDFYHP